MQPRSLPHRRLHALTWLAWAVAAAATVQLAPSPAYVALVVAVSIVVVEAHAVDSPLARAYPAFVGLGVTFALVRVVLTAATVHGVGDVLVTLPEGTLPRLLGGFTVGGTVELPVLLRAAAEGFAVVGMVAAFGAFNAVVSHHELVASAPRAFYEPGLVVTVALAFVPSTLTALRDVREADQARTGGRVVRRGRLVRQLVPLLESGMERAVTLAESMDARGFGAQPTGPGERAAGWAGVVALVSLGGAFVALVGRAPGVALALACLGGCALAAAALAASRSARRVRYRPRRMTGVDWAVVAVVVAVPLAMAAIGVTGDDTLRFVPEALGVPPVNPLAVVAVAALCAPLAVRAP